MAASQSEVLLTARDSSPTAKPRSGRSRLTSLYARYITNWWLVELLSVLLGLAGVIALCLLLRRYDGKPVPRTNAVVGVNITLNTLVSILSTISRAALLLSVSECISQSKWSWYLHRQRPLEDLDIFDQASRGAWGGLQLLWKVNIRQIASVGALLVIGGLAVDPLSQQLVHYRVQIVPGPSGSAILPAASNWTGSTQDTSTFDGQSSPGDTTPRPPLPMKGAIQSGLFTQNSVVLDVQPTCSSGNCTWPSYRSLAICARSADVTSSLKIKNVNVAGDVPGEGKHNEQEWYLSQQNNILSSGEILCNLSSVAKRRPIVSTGGTQDLVSDDSQNPGDPISLNFTDSIAFKDSTRPVADVFMIYANKSEASGDDPGTFSATEFLLEWCVQNFTTTVANGVSSTQRHESFQNFSKPDPNEASAFLTATPDDGDNRQYTIDPNAHYILQNYFRGLFQGTVNLSSSPEAQKSATNDATQALFQPFDIFGEKVNGVDQVPGRGVGISGLQGILDNIATGMTNMIRINDNMTNGALSEPIQGSANQLETFVEVQWGWIAAPIVLLIGSVLFFLAAMISSSRRQKPEIWKSSSLPLLKALNEELHAEGLNGMRTTSAIKDWAQDVPVRLSRDIDGGGWQLVRCRSENGTPDGQELRTLNRT